MESHLIDAQLVSRYLNGEEYALEILIEKYQHRISGFIFSKVKDREVTDDLFQDTFVKVIKSLKKGGYNEEGKFLPWVMRIAHNIIIDYFRKKNRIPVVKIKDDFNIFSVISDESLHIEDQMVLNRIHFEVKALVSLLPEDQKEVIEMRLFKEMSFKEISENTGVSINTALGRMRYALINLRKQMEANHLSLSA